MNNPLENGSPVHPETPAIIRIRHFAVTRRGPDPHLWRSGPLTFDPLLLSSARKPQLLAQGLLQGRLASRWFLRHLWETAAEIFVIGSQDNLVTRWKFFVATLDSGLVL